MPCEGAFAKPDQEAQEGGNFGTTAEAVLRGL